jgi:hypothetical protein
MKTQNEVRKSFWDSHPEFKEHYRRTKKQNDYNATIRSAFVSWLDIQHRDGQISDNLASRCTLGAYYIKVGKMANFDFWIGCFRPRSEKWKRQTLKRLQSGKSNPFDDGETADKIEALKILLK